MKTICFTVSVAIGALALLPGCTSKDHKMTNPGKPSTKHTDILKGIAKKYHEAAQGSVSSQCQLVDNDLRSALPKMRDHGENKKEFQAAFTSAFQARDHCWQIFNIVPKPTTKEWVDEICVSHHSACELIFECLVWAQEYFRFLGPQCSRFAADRVA